MSIRKYASKENQSKHDKLESKLYNVFKRVEDRLRKKMDYGDVLDHSSYRKARAQWSAIRNQCPECGSSSTRVEDYSMMWHDGDVVCNQCDTFVRDYDAG